MATSETKTPTASGRTRRVRLALDTNFVVQMGKPGNGLLDAVRAELGHDIEFVLLDSVRNELAVRLRDPKTKPFTRLGLNVLSNVKTNVRLPEPIAGIRSADDELERAAKDGLMVATLDARLRKRIKAFGGPILYLKKGNRVAMD